MGAWARRDTGKVVMGVIVMAHPERMLLLLQAGTGSEREGGREAQPAEETAAPAAAERETCPIWRSANLSEFIGHSQDNGSNFVLSFSLFPLASFSALFPAPTGSLHSCLPSLQLQSLLCATLTLCSTIFPNISRQTDLFQQPEIGPRGPSDCKAKA